jgi:predicted DNA-binding protein
MTMQRVQMLLAPEQRRKLAELAKARGKSVAEITRQAIDAGLEKLIVMEQRERMLAALAAAQKLRDSMPMLDVDVVAEIQQMREEQEHKFLR